jgi:hypothetical protein
MKTTSGGAICRPRIDISPPAGPFPGSLRPEKNPQKPLNITDGYVYIFWSVSGTRLAIDKGHDALNVMSKMIKKKLG